MKTIELLKINLFLEICPNVRPLVFGAECSDKRLSTQDLRPNIQSIYQYAQALKQLVEQRTQECVAANGAMEMLVRDAWDLSLVTSHTLLVHRQRYDLVEVCEQVLAAYSTKAGRRLNFEVGRVPVEVEIDRERIGQVLIHLLFLARASSPEGTPLKVMLTQTSAEAIVMIQAMEVENLAEHPLERFYRREPADGQGHSEDEGKWVCSWPTTSSRNTKDRSR